jgi:2-polyprenyl-6-methoxyphenol hydroxylase-like FAD-dependent oxidoreductase
MPENNNQKRILIAGAGPTGLTAAVELSRQGIIPKIIDKKDGPSPLSRAVGIMPASLNILSPSGVTKQLVDEGIKMKFAQIFNIDKRLARISLSGGHPDWDFAIALAQDRTEHVLIKALKRYGGSVEYGNELTDIRQEGEKVKVNINNGPDEEYDYVLGADGIHSVVRNSLGIEYPGFDLPETWSIADVDAVNWPYPEAGTICILPEGKITFTVPLETNRYRVVSNSDDALAALPLKLEVTKKHREGQFTISIRQVKEYRKGNVCLAGDAAHCHSPAGGRGMNLGIADAAEWAGRIIGNNLEGYSQSRHEAGASTIALSERLRKTTTSTNPITKILLTIVAALINLLPPMQRRMAKTFLDG